MYAQAKVTVTAQNIRNRVGDTVTITPQQTGIVGKPTWSVVATTGTLPAGLVADPATGKVNAKVTGVGNASFVLRVTDSLDQRSFDSDAFSIVTKPAFAISGLAGAYRVRVGTYKETDQPVVVGAQSPVRYALSIATPSNMSFDATTGVLSGVPNVQGSNPTVTLTATDPTVGDTRTSTATFSFDILGPMTVSNTSNVTVRSGADITARSYVPAAVNALDPTKVTWQLASGTLPAGVTVDPATGKLAGNAPVVTSQTVTTGYKVMAIDVDQSQATSTTPFSITINPTLDFTVADQTAREGQAFSYTPARTGNYGTLTWAATGLPSPLAMSAGTGAVSGTPSAPGTSSPYTVEVSLKDDADGTDPVPLKKTFKLTVLPSPILAVDQTSMALADQNLPDTSGACSTLRVTNSGSADATDLAWNVQVPTTPASSDPAFKTTCTPVYSASVPVCTTKLGTGKQCVIGVSMAGSVPNAYSGILDVTATGAAKKSVSLSGTIKPAFESFTFTTCGAFPGSVGPTSTQCLNAYKSVSWTQDSSKLSFIDGVQAWKVPLSGTYKFVATGATGGNGRYCCAGYGATVTSTATLAKGDTVYIVVGQRGDNNNSNRGGGGGGGTWVQSVAKGWIAVAGGGGGGGELSGGSATVYGSTTNSGNRGADSGGFGGTGGGGGNGGSRSAGGAGINGGGGNGGGAGGGTLFYGGYGNDGRSNGGFGGGGGGGSAGGGGGGYSGGGGGGGLTTGGGGGSYFLPGGSAVQGTDVGAGSVTVSLQ